MIRRPPRSTLRESSAASDVYKRQNAGYDLQALVDTDIWEHPEAYGIAAPDKNIDFRRVRNLKVFFSRNAVKLTTNVSETEQWQGGDIVIFERHIGIVSDRRNKNGVPYIIHHNDPWQTAYEQDVLEKRTDIVGHYRISEHRDKDPLSHPIPAVRIY